jgi:hypothetical protein
MGTSAPALAYPPSLAPERKVYRAYPFSDFFDPKKGKPVPKLFYRKKNELGLSVAFSPEGILAVYPGAAGMCCLLLSDIEQCPDQLHLLQDSEDHAEIRGIPTRDEDQEKALRIAKYLARVAIHCQ